MNGRWVACLVAVALCTACTTSGRAPEQETTAPSPIEFPTAVVTPDAGQQPEPTRDPPTPSPPPPSALEPMPTPTTPPRAQRLELRTGQTAHLAYFDVTFQRFAHGEDGISAGWKVEVCYVRPHPAQNPDNTTRVSADPWSVLVRDGEGGGEASWIPVNDFPRDEGWSPAYPTTQLRLGTCQLGWLGVRHGNPDLQFIGLRYSPADFGDVVTWRTG